MCWHGPEPQLQKQRHQQQRRQDGAGTYVEGTWPSPEARPSAGISESCCCRHQSPTKLLRLGGEALQHCQMERAYWEICSGAPSISARRRSASALIDKALGVVLFRDGQITSSSPAKRARARVAMADRQATTRRASTPQRRCRASESAAPSAALPCTPPNASAQTMRWSWPPMHRDVPAMLTAHHSVAAPTVYYCVDRHRPRLRGAVTLPPGRLGGPHHDAVPLITTTQTRTAGILMLQTLHRRRRRPSVASRARATKQNHQNHQNRPVVCARLDSGGPCMSRYALALQRLLSKALLTRRAGGHLGLQLQFERTCSPRGISQPRPMSRTAARRALPRAVSPA
jgi:hypothetical protein